MWILNAPIVLFSDTLKKSHMIPDLNFKSSSFHVVVFCVHSVFFGGASVMCLVGLCRRPKIIPDIKKAFNPRGDVCPLVIEYWPTLCKALISSTVKKYRIVRTNLIAL